MLTAARFDKARLKGLFLILYLYPPMHAQLSEQHLREAAIEAVRISTQQPNTFFVIHRREDMEDILLSVRPYQAGGFERDPQIFEVSDDGYEFKNDSVDYHLSVHGPFLYFVAVANATGETFRISGFKDSQTEFNRLAKYYNVKLRTEVQAQEFANLYLQLDPVHYRLAQAASLLQLKQLAEKQFNNYYKAFSSAETRFNQWWTKHESALNRMSFRETSTTTLEGFEVSFLTVSGIDEKSQRDGPLPIRVTLKISKDGQVAEPTLAPFEPR